MVNGEKFQCHDVTLTLIGQCPMSNSSELFSYTTICSSLLWIEPLFFSYRVDRHTDRQTDNHTDTDEHEYSIVVAKNHNYKNGTPLDKFRVLYFLPIEFHGLIAELIS